MRFFTLISLLLILTNCKKEKSRICELYAGEMGFETGTIQKYVSGPAKVTYSYSYSVNGINYTGKEKHYGIGQKNECLLGMDFLVVFNINDHGESDLNLDYPIESEAELQQLKDEFVDTPPDPDWPKCK
jgi:hypothetical protein